MTMHSVQRDVEAFHRALDIPIGDTPAIRRAELRANLIMEEACETAEAILGKRVEWIKEAQHIREQEGPDLVKAIDGLCDLLCVTYGAAVEFGIDLAPFWDEVHRTNMAKAPDCDWCGGSGRQTEGETIEGPSGEPEEQWYEKNCEHCDGTGKDEPRRREDGKVLKPEGWQPPDIRGVLERTTGWAS